MKFRHRFRVHAPLLEVAEFHRHAAGLQALTPPFSLMRFEQFPDPLHEGCVLKFHMWMGPILIRWESYFPEWTATGFLDTQHYGPFASWEHRHTFVPISDDVTEVVDEIETHLHPHLWYRFVGLIMWMTLPMLFVYRKWQTRRLLER